MGSIADFFGLNDWKKWNAFAEEIGGEFVRGSWLRSDVVRASYKHWTIIMDTVNHNKTTYTRFRIPCRSDQPLKIDVYYSNWTAQIGKWLGMQDIIVGDPDFDKAFIVKGSDKRVIEILDKEMRYYLMAHPYLYIKSRGSKFEEFILEVSGCMTDHTKLMMIFRFIAMTLDRMHTVNAINDVKIK